MKKLMTFVFLLLALAIVKAPKAQPQPSDVFRDYIWTTPEKSPFKFLRIIGDGDYREPVEFKPVYPAESIEDGWVIFDHDIDLDKAVKAELQLEKVQSHEGTTGLAFKMNGFNWHFLKMPDAIPEPKANYLQHNYPIASIPLEEIKAGKGNRIRFRVDTLQRFGMPQNILYGFRLRVYYDQTKNHAFAQIKGVSQGKSITVNPALELANTKGDITEVNWVGLFKDVNYEGDGIYRQWHYTFYRGEMRNHIGTSKKAPFLVNWDISWIPDQDKQIQLSALVKDANGIIYFLPAVENLQLKRDYSVEFCTPFGIPEAWATRAKVFEEKISVQGDPRQAEAFQLAFTSWSPGYLNGITVNDWLIPSIEDCLYCYGVHRLTVNKPFFLKKGTNLIRTGLTPKVWGKMVHGAEIQFPGIMLLVKYPKAPVIITEEIYKDTPHFKVETSSGTWYIEKQSGGCSSLIDSDGKDWIAFKKDGNEGPTNSADSDYRGLPNLVYKDPGNGVGHPGFDQCTTEHVSDNELLVRSKDRKWQFRWIFHGGYAEIAVEKTDETRNYWVLFEGPAGGKFSPGSHYWGNDVDGLRSDQPSLNSNPVVGNWQWAFFGDNWVNTTLFIAQKENDMVQDFFAYMGNSNTQGILSADGMNVFGFGRDRKATPLLSGQHRFYVGLYPEKVNSPEGVLSIKHLIDGIIK